jgi:hypothetical protein
MGEDVKICESMREKTLRDVCVMIIFFRFYQDRHAGQTGTADLNIEDHNPCFRRYQERDKTDGSRDIQARRIKYSKL